MSVHSRPATQRVAEATPPLRKHGGARPNSGGRRPGAGRRKGVPNKINADLKEAILRALHRAGGDDYLLQVAKDDPRTFCALIGRVLPMTVQGGETPVKTILEVRWGGTVGSSAKYAKETDC